MITHKLHIIDTNIPTCITSDVNENGKVVYNYIKEPSTINSKLIIIVDTAVLIKLGDCFLRDGNILKCEDEKHVLDSDFKVVASNSELITPNVSIGEYNKKDYNKVTRTLNEVEIKYLITYINKNGIVPSDVEVVYDLTATFIFKSNNVEKVSQTEKSVDEPTYTQFEMYEMLQNLIKSDFMTFTKEYGLNGWNEFNEWYNKRKK